MEIVGRDKNKEKIESKQAEIAKEKKRLHDEAMARFRESAAYRYVMDYFQHEEDYFSIELEKLRLQDMQALYMLPLKKQRAKLVEMSKRDAVLTGVLSIIKRVKSKL